MSIVTDFIRAKKAPALHMIKVLKEIEEKVLATAKHHVETEVAKTVDEMKEAGLSMIVDVAEEKMVELKASLSKRFSEEVMADVVKVFERDDITQRFRGKAGVSPKPEDIVNLLIASESFIKRTKAEDGETPIKGVHYDDGEDGKSPKPEVVAEELMKNPSFIEKTKGRDGSPDKPEQVANKLNKTTESVNLSVIKGLKEALSNLTRNIRKKGGGSKGGGGMGTPLPFSFDGDGATTEFALPGAPSGPNLAIWVYYQGQWLQPTVHYNVKGTTLTLTFTPDNATKVEGFLIP